MKIFEIKTFVDEKNNCIQTLSDGETETMRGQAVLNLQVPGQTQAIPFTFPITDMTMTEAFTRFDELAKIGGENKLKEMRAESLRRQIMGGRG